MIMQPWYIKVIGAFTASGLLLAQEVPVDWNWTKYPLDALCVGVLFWIMTRTYPGLLTTFTEQLKNQQEANSKVIDNVLGQHKDSMNQLTSMLSTKIDAQTATIAAAVKGFNK